MTVPAAVLQAFSDRAVIGPSEVCRLLSINQQTLRRHCKAGNISYVQTGFGERSPRRAFTLEAVMRFLAERSRTQPCQSASRTRARTTSTTSGGEANAFKALLARRSAERQKAEAGTDRGVPARRAKLVAEARGQPSSAQARN